MSHFCLRKLRDNVPTCVILLCIVSYYFIIYVHTLKLFLISSRRALQFMHFKVIFSRNPTRLRFEIKQASFITKDICL